MRVRAIDTDNDWIFGRGLQDYKIDGRAVAQNVKTRLQSFYGDCFFDEESGIDWFNLLGYGTQELLEIAIKQTILETEGVSAIKDINISFDRERRNIWIKYDLQTIYSESYIEELTI